MMRKKLTQFFLSTLTLLCCAATLSAQPAQVRGRILSSDNGEPLLGASVVVVGTATGTTVGEDGTFALQAAVGQTLQFSFVGFTTQTRTVARAGENMGDITLQSEAMLMDGVTVTASLVVPRQTPIAVSVIDPTMIENKLSTQEFPEILKSTPSVYATKQGGGYGDSRVNIRGFSSENVAVMVNGVPMNEMEWGGIYWSNWTGLNDVTRQMQVQRGIGASKVAAPSVGGSINILTYTVDAEPGGTLSYAMGNDGYNKVAFSVSTGLNKGWAMTILGSKTWGDGYIQGTEFTGYNYFVNISKRINDSHLLSFTGFGSPQEHNRRSDDLLISEWQRVDQKYRYNAAYGFDMNGKRKSNNKNVYHKPQVQLNHLWTINNKSSLSTALYASFGRGYGYSGQGYNSTYRNKWYATSNTGEINTEFRSPDGTFDYGAIYDLNQNSENGSLMAMAKNINNHNWFGLLSTYTTKIGDYFDVYGGIDFRYYIGEHVAKLHDLYGGEYFINSDNRRNVQGRENDIAFQNQKLKKGDVVYRDYDGYVVQGGVFGQAEYKKDKVSAFVAGSVSNTTYWRYDRFYYDEANAKSPKLDFWGYTAKGGANYNIDERHNVFANIGWISRAPYFSDGVFLQKEVSNEVNSEAKNEKIFSVELGYGYKSRMLDANLNLYRTQWKDKAMTTTFSIQDSQERGKLNLTGVNALHQGIELELFFRPITGLTINGMLSFNDWHWDSNASGYSYDSQGNPLTSAGAIASGIGAEDHAKTTVNLKDVKVGNSAQTTFALGANYNVTKRLRFGVDYTFTARNYSNFNLRGSDMIIGGVKDYATPWRIPSYGITDANMSYTFPMGKMKATFGANVNNIFNQVHITDAVDGSTHDWTTAQVYYGFGRTYSVRLKLSF